MATVMLHRATPRATASTIARWMLLIEKHGGPGPALEALLRDREKLERLQRALHACGLDPEQLLQNDGGRRPR